MENTQFQQLVLQQLGVLIKGQTKLEENQENLAKKLDIIYEQTAIPTDFRTEVNERLELLQRTQDRQEKILGRLSLRSIEQEADIAHLRMAK